MKIIDFILKFITRRPIKILLICSIVYFVYTKFVVEASDIFKGAFWAIFVGYLTFIATKFHELSTRRFNSMVYLEQELYLCMNDLAGNLSQIQKALDSEQITTIFPMNIVLSENDIKELGRIDLKQDLSYLFIGIRRMNHSIRSISSIFEKNMDNFKQIPFPSPEEGRRVISSFYDYYKEELKKIYDFGQQLDEEIKGCLVKLRFFVRVDRLLFSSKLLLSYYSKNDYKKWLVEDNERIKKELSYERIENPKLCGWLFIPGYPEITKTTNSVET